MAFHLTNFPEHYPANLYKEAEEELMTRLKDIEGVVAVYRFGHIRHPGISDLDILVAFARNKKHVRSPLQSIGPNFKYPFTHSLLGGNSDDLRITHQYSFYHNYKLLWGEDIFDSSSATVPALSDEQTGMIKKQIALEFLISNYISRTIEKKNKRINVRNLLLGTNAIRYDLEYLEVTDGDLMNAINIIVDWREQWFEKQPGNKAIIDWFLFFHEALENFLRNWFREQFFYLPSWASPQISKTVRLTNGKKPGFSCKGIFLPFLQTFGQRGWKLQKKMSNFEFTLPITNQPADTVLETRYHYFKHSIKYNRQYLPGFAPLLPGMIANMLTNR